MYLFYTSTFLYWAWESNFNDFSKALSYSISVLIVTCPCALALAAPVALALGAAGLNCLHLLAIKMSSIEKLSHVTTLVFDKTGTVTTGKPKLKSIKLIGNDSSESVLQIAASLELGSHHPFAKAIMQAHEEEGGELLNINKIEQHSGRGIEAELDGVKWRLGSEKFAMEVINSKKAPLNNDEFTQIKIWRDEGYSVLFLSNTTQLQAVFCINDPLREGIESFIDTAKETGIQKHIILSGDHQQSVDAVAKQLGITEAYGGLSPRQKLDWVKNYQTTMQKKKKLSKLMMLGDGINDAPTLAVADISLSFSDATDLAKNNSDFILLGKDYQYLGKAFQLMRNTRKIILQNLSWAIAYNIIAVPLAVMGLITPWMAAIGMSLSSLFVVLNSMRLKTQCNDNTGSN